MTLENDADSSFLPEPKPLDGLLVIVLQTPAILSDSRFRPRNGLKALDLFSDAEIASYGVSPLPQREYAAVTIVDTWSGVHNPSSTVNADLLA